VLARSSEGKDRVEDIVQDVILVAVERIGRYDPKRGSLWAWLCGIAVNKLRESARNVKRGGLLRQGLTARLPSAAAPSDESSSELFQALGGIHPRHQEVLSLKYMEGLSVRAIAKALGSSEKAIESRLSRAREAFRKAYRDCQTEVRKE
jgi:RNA polymerase sigma factor (sigma-70 family)